LFEQITNLLFPRTSAVLTVHTDGVTCEHLQAVFQCKQNSFIRNKAPFFQDKFFTKFHFNPK